MARSTSRDDFYHDTSSDSGSAVSERRDSIDPDRTGTNASTGELNVPELIKIFRRRRRFIIATMLCGTTAIFALGLLIPPKYTATAQITIRPDDSVPSSPVRSETAIETHVRTLLSRDSLQRVADDLNGVNEPGTLPFPAQQTQTGQAADHTPLRNVASSWLPSPLELARRLGIWTGLSGSRNTTGWNLEQLKRRLRIDQEGQSRIIDVSYTSTDPETAATVANRVVELYLRGQRERARAADADELDRLSNRLAELKADIQRSTAGVQGLVQQRLDSASAADPGKIDQRLQQLGSEAAAKSQLYQALLRRQQQLRDQGESITPDVRVLSLAAVPDRPSSTSPFLYILPALIIFLICGTALSVILERFDRGLRSGREINEALGIPCIGLIPRVAEVGRDCPLHHYLLANPHAACAEALRAIAATLHLSSQRHPPRVILITSSVPGEGRTTLSVSLSTCMAMLRQRVLLIDLDLDHSSAPIGSAEHERPGTVDVLLKGDSTVEAIRCLPELGIDYLPMQRCAAYPQMLVAGTQMERLLQEALGGYDCIMINSPPLFGGTETRLLARLADQILFVVKWGSTTRELAQNALRLLRDPDHSCRHQDRRLGAVITQVDLEKHVLYGYGDIGDYLLEYERRQASNATSIESAPVLGAAARNDPAFRGRIAAAPLRRKIVDTLTAACWQAVAAPSGLRTRIARWTAGLARIDEFRSR
jgi:polysaccharide biosynthesis transport protein